LEKLTVTILIGAAILAGALAFIPCRRAYDPIKRAVDLSLAIVAAIVFAPIILAAAIAVKLDSKGPIFYVADRIGANGRRIRIWKLRTMVSDADRWEKITRGNDPRVTRVGRLLRATKIDEMPQIFNVFLGTMSIVGPRPEASSLVERYYTPADHELFDIAPGLTCAGTLYYYLHDEDNHPPTGISAEEYYAQVSLRTKLAADLHYVRHRCLAYDVRLIAWSIVIIASRLLGCRLNWMPDNMRGPGSTSEQKMS
jgi:lipopolysaccharide/colanic/teichoic acid biosynthesis glycosyltransferase